MKNVTSFRSFSALFISNSIIELPPVPIILQPTTDSRLRPQRFALGFLIISEFIPESVQTQATSRRRLLLTPFNETAMEVFALARDIYASFEVLCLLCAPGPFLSGVFRIFAHSECKTVQRRIFRVLSISFNTPRGGRLIRVNRDKKKKGDPLYVVFGTISKRNVPPL